MDQYTKDLLTAWGFADFIPRFEEETIDARTLRGLNENEIIQLIPNIGMRSRFRNLLESWKADMNSADLPADQNASLSNLLEEAERNEPSVSGVQRTSVPEEFPPGICRDYLLKTQLGRSLLAKAKEQEIVEEDRKNASVLVIDGILEKEPSRLIQSAVFQRLANELCEIFPGTSPASFFLTFLPKTPFQHQRNLSGPLYKAYVKKRDKFRKSGVLPPSSRSASSSRSSSKSTPTSGRSSLKRAEAPDPTSYTEETRTALNFLETNVYPWKAVEDFWRATEKERKSILADEGIFNYFLKFPALRIQERYRLLLDDFTREFPGKENNLFANIALAKDKIIKLAKLKLVKLSDKKLKESYERVLESAKGEDPTIRNDALILLLPLITPPPGNVGGKSGAKKTATKPTNVEIRDHFVTLIHNDAHIQEAVNLRKKALQSGGETFSRVYLPRGNGK
ncbi:uncharacterized protein LOC112462781 [Temnothorax curvispinosus]|uniref:Uncharacterized protein LOC112462781 n=1 Tax=Temnothorax curvispinosus TaxID=300111 RepID=A0A6J1QQ01_9HYME|nr:uncharacterized protein LOC112462781 [Temnothorax curvispinosus]